jgi:shikimate dehydrogenase
MSDLYAVIGNPIAQSKSPPIHLAFAEATGQSIRYERVLGPLGGFARTVDALRASGALGLNVTAPFKLDAFAYAHERSEDAQWAGAANALKFEGPLVKAQNFDGIGLVRDVVDNLGVPMRGRRVLLLGAGGAARGALLPFLREAPSRLVIANRSVDKAHELAALARTRCGPMTEVQSCGVADLARQAFDIVFNATSASLSGQGLPLPHGLYAADALAYDMTYGKGLTPFLAQARADGATRWVDGVGMLVEQAAEAFAWWRGVRPATRDVIQALTVPLDAA